MTRPLQLTRRSFAALSGAAAASALAPAGAAPQQRPVVVELFTSQGCSASPPADALLAELGRRPGVVALSLNVDYWDYRGWRDTLGSADCAQRQRDYAAHRGDGRVYTPQAVINGRAEMLGSDRSGLLAAIDSERDREVVDVSLSSGAREVRVEVGDAPSQALRQDATIWVATLIPQAVVHIERGENAGRTVVYTNVVRKIVPAGMWHGGRTALTLPRPALMTEGTVCVALLQADGTGPILGASIPDDGA
ncbi:MAG: DUF1223 domain-containing protein [Hyphomicrobiales bacterium]